MFEYHISLHHSQTLIFILTGSFSFEYHISLHHSQTVKHIDALEVLFEYHISLHHSQTRNRRNKLQSSLNTIYLYIILKLYFVGMLIPHTFEYHISLHHSQTWITPAMPPAQFEYHISLHHSQTSLLHWCNSISLNTIYLYIILKPIAPPTAIPACLNTIYLYIILKL